MFAELECGRIGAYGFGLGSWVVGTYRLGGLLNKVFCHGDCSHGVALLELPGFLERGHALSVGKGAGLVLGSLDKGSERAGYETDRLASDVEGRDG